ncbi:hypothetical protein LIER_37772 [Lithospermum erythrorhizon]|uniref:Retrotransposon gag domain-containing protein n=1 Tax=Lithospermum erythrorhizon TaxID=34254 RepID=A0AAV3PVJ0_LITER
MNVEVATMHLEGDALNLYAWINGEDEILLWEELVKVFQENYGPPEFQNPNEFPCALKQTGTIIEYCQEFARLVARVKDWQDHCLLGVFLIGLKDELKTEVRIHKPRTVFKAASLALDERQQRKDKGLYYRCRAPFSPGHRCKSTLSIMEYRDNTNNVILEAADEEAWLYEQETANDNATTIPSLSP